MPHLAHQTKKSGRLQVNLGGGLLWSATAGLEIQVLSVIVAGETKGCTRDIVVSFCIASISANVLGRALANVLQRPLGAICAIRFVTDPCTKATNLGKKIGIQVDLGGGLIWSATAG